MRLIDTHCHLTHPPLRQKLPQVLQRSRQAGVVAVICAAGNLHESKAALRLTRQHDEIYCTVGIHPHDAKKAHQGYLQVLEDLAQESRNVGIGEVGLDYHYNYSPPDVQRRVFAEQLELGNRLGKKIVVHMREAFEDTLRILRDSGVSGADVVFHSFTEGPDQAREVLNFGAMISFSGIVTFKNSGQLREAAKLIPEDRILIETDGPFLSPEPVRKMKTNEPANVAHVAACLAPVRNTSPEHIAELTTANAQRFFHLDTP